MSVPARVAALTAAFLLVVGLVVFVAFYYVGSATTQLPTIHYAASGGQVSVTLQEDPQNDSNTRPDWVTYYTQDPNSKQWVHTTLFSIPANTRVNMTIYGYDGCTPLRNNYFSQVQGVTGNTIAVQQFDKNNKPLGGVKSESVVNSWADCNVGPYLRHPGPGDIRPGRLAEREQLRQQPVRHVAVHADLGRCVRGRDLQLHVPGPDRRLPVAVPRPVRRRVPRRQRRPHADSRMDDGLYGRGGLMSSAAEVPGQNPRTRHPRIRLPGPGSRRATARLAHVHDLDRPGAGRRPRHLVRLVPAPAAGPHVHRGQAPAVRHRRAGHHRRAGRPRRVHLLHLLDRGLAGPARRRGRRAADLRQHQGPGDPGSSAPRRSCSFWPCSAPSSSSGPAGAGAGEGPSPIWTQAGSSLDLDTGHEHRAPGPGDRPAVDLDVPLPAVRRDGDHPALPAGRHAGRRST